MLRRIKRVIKFWEKNGPNYPYQIKGIKIAVLAPENYKYCRNISVPSGNRERKWGFKTADDLKQFKEFYSMCHRIHTGKSPEIF